MGNVMDEVISIVIPCYNVEKYLNQCLESVVNQTYSALQIILVDDKSPDGSGALCDEWAARDNRIQVVHKEVNEGLGYARNTGLEYVKGDYILFLDSDDFYDLDLCEKALNRLKESNADVCYFGHKKYVNGKFIENSDVLKLKDEYDGSSIIEEFLAPTIGQAPEENGAPKVGMSAWRILYRADLVFGKNLKFCSEREYLCEDLFFRIELCKNINKVAVVKENLYSYRYNDNSLTSRYREDRFEASKKLYSKLNECVEGLHNEDINTRAKRCFMNNLLVCLKQEEVYSKKRFKQAVGKIKEFADDSFVQSILGSYPIAKMEKSNKLLFWLLFKGHALTVFGLVRAKRVFR